MRKLLQDRRLLLQRLIMAEVLARPGEGPLTPRHRQKQKAPRGALPAPEAAAESK